MTTIPRPGHHRLSNGLPVLLFPQERLHSVELGLFIRSGPRFEAPSTNGVSHFTEHMLFRGTEHFSTFDLHARVETLGGPIAALTGRDHCTYYLQLPRRHLPEAVSLFSEIFLRPTFEDIEVERPIILEERLEDLSDRGDDLSPETHSRRLMWGDAPLAMTIMGTEANIRGFTAEDLRAHHRRAYTSGNSLLYLAGPVDAGDLPMIEAALGAMPPGPRLDFTPVSPLPPSRRMRFVDHDAAQDSTMLSFPAPSLSSPDLLALTALHIALADGMTSRLQWNICERLGLVYDVDAGLDCYPDVGALDITALSGPGKLVPLLRAILAVLAELAREPMGEAELHKVKERYRVGVELGMDSAGALASRVAGEALYDLRRDVAADLAAVDALTPEDLRRVAAEVFKPGDLSLVVVGRPTRRERRAVAELLDGDWLR